MISARLLVTLFSPVLLLAACSVTARPTPAEKVPQATPDEPTQPASSPAATAIPPAVASLSSGEPDIPVTPAPVPTNVRVDGRKEYRLPISSLPFDAIFPVYDPVFSPAGEAPLMDDELVIGIEIDGEAKAYPVTVLRFREIVDDELAGWPILVTW